MTYQYHDETIIHTLPESTVFVFGSDLKGQHSTGAARIAVRHFGALIGVAKGWSGQSFAIPILDEDLEPLPLAQIAAYIDDFKIYTQNHPQHYYFITALGCGSAGHAVAHIAPLFKHVSDNVILPYSFYPYIDEHAKEAYPDITRDFLKTILDHDLVLADDVTAELHKTSLSIAHQAIAEQVIEHNLYPEDHLGRGRVHEVQDIVARLKNYDADFNALFDDRHANELIGGVVLALMELYQFTEQELLAVWQQNLHIQHPIHRPNHGLTKSV